MRTFNVHACKTIHKTASIPLLNGLCMLTSWVEILLENWSNSWRHQWLTLAHEAR